MKCKVVSKHWSSIISDSQFVRDYSKETSFRSCIPCGLYFYNSLNKNEEIETVSLEDDQTQPSGAGVPFLSFLLDGVPARGTIKILQSCHGLLLCKLTCQSNSGVVVDYIVCNPTTRKHKIIPRPFLQPTQSIVSMSLAFDPSESLHYKLVCVKRILSYNKRDWQANTHNLEVYSSETGSWRSTSCFLSNPSTSRFKNPFYWNGTIHWVRCGPINYSTDEFNFKTAKHKIRFLPIKPIGDCIVKCPMRYFGQSRGYWHIIDIGSLSAYQFNVLEMDNDTSKWSVKYSVDIHPSLSSFPEIICDAGPDQYSDADASVKVYAFSILSFIKGEKHADSELVLLIPGKVVSYKFNHQTIKVLRELPSQVVDSSTFGFLNSYQFVDSLAPV